MTNNTNPTPRNSGRNPYLSTNVIPVNRNAVGGEGGEGGRRGSGIGQKKKKTRNGKRSSNKSFQEFWGPSSGR